MKRDMIGSLNSKKADVRAVSCLNIFLVHVILLLIFQPEKNLNDNESVLKDFRLMSGQKAKLSKETTDS